MAIFASLITKLGFDTTAMPKGVAAYKGHLGQMEGDTKSFLKNIKSEFGKGSAAAQWTKLLMGGGAIAGLNLVSKEVEAFTGKIGEMANKMRAGEMSGKEMGAEFVREIPIFGHVVKSVDNIIEALTGQEAIMNKVEAAYKRQIALANQVQKTYDDSKKGIKSLKEETADHIKKLNDDSYLRGLSGGQKEMAKVQIDTENAVADARKRAYKEAGFDAEKFASLKAQIAKEEKKQINSKDFIKSNTFGHTFEGDMKLYNSAKEEQSRKISMLKNEQTILAGAKKAAEEQSAQEVIAIEANKLAKIREMDRNDSEEFAKDQQQEIKRQQDRVKEQAEWEIKQLEEQKQGMQDVLAEDKAKSHGGSARSAQSAAIRGNSFTVQFAQAVEDPTTKEAKKITEELKKLNKTIEEKKNNLAANEHQQAMMIPG